MLVAKGLRKTFGDFVALGDITVAFEKGKFTCIVGPSGCGKTTLLRCLSGLMAPSGGEIRLDGRAFDTVPKEMALVFQDYSRSLYPWMTVSRNVAFPLENLNLPRAEIGERVAAALASVGLSEATNKFPWQLSGGMQQRTAIARAIAYQPQILLMDEPFASVDAQTRSELEDLMLSLKAQYGMTVIFVTHDIDESVYLGDKVVILGSRPTRVEQELLVDLPASRTQIATKASARFHELRRTVFERIMTQTKALHATE